MKLTKNIENYLKGIYLLQENNDFNNKNLATYLNISSASVSEMLKKLDKANYLKIENKKITLTEKGQKIATEIIRKHRIWEVFLVEILHFTDKKEAHHIAESLEHATCNELLNKLSEFLKYPQFSPNGKIISYQEQKNKDLGQALVEEKLIIIEIKDFIKKYTDNKGLKENQIYQLIEIDPYNQAVTLENYQQRIILAKEILQHIKIVA